MDMSTWRPHGLVYGPELESYYQQHAKTIVDESGNASEPKEEMAVRLFTHLLSKYVFPGTNHAVVPEAAPPNRDGKACDFVVEEFTAEMAPQVLCFVEVKRWREVTDSRIVDLEEQVLGYCTEYLQANPSRRRVYACTIVGTYVRCWLVTYECTRIEMTGLWEWFERGTFRYYLDIGLETSKNALERAFHEMKRFP